MICGNFFGSFVWSIQYGIVKNGAYEVLWGKLYMMYFVEFTYTLWRKEKHEYEE